MNNLTAIPGGRADWEIKEDGVVIGHVDRGACPSANSALKHWKSRDNGCNGIKASDLQVGGEHYKDMEIQPHYFCHVNQLGSLESNIVKYACRHHQKGGRKDVEKIIHYAQLLLEWQYGED